MQVDLHQFALQQLSLPAIISAIGGLGTAAFGLPAANGWSEAFTAVFESARFR